MRGVGPLEVARLQYIAFLAKCDAFSETLSQKDKAIFWQAIRDNMKQAIEESE